MTILKSETVEEEKLNYTIYHWGPLLFKTKIKPNDIKALRERGD